LNNDLNFDITKSIINKTFKLIQRTYIETFIIITYYTLKSIFFNTNIFHQLNTKALSGYTISLIVITPCYLHDGHLLSLTSMLCYKQSA
jgi:hypothetical protein